MRFVIAVVLVVLGLGVATRAPAEGAPAGKAAAGSAAGSNAAAGGAKQRGPAPAAAQDLARALVSNDDWSRVLDEYASGLAGHVADSLTARGDAVPEDLEPSIRKQLGQELPYDNVVDAQAQALAKQFTPDELRKAATFYASPLGKKVTQGVPKAQTELGQHLQARLATAVPQIVKRVAPRAIASDAPGAGSSHAGASGSASSEPTEAGSSKAGRDDAARGTGSTSPPSGEAPGGAQPPAAGGAGKRP
ncbi:MAG TPA: DUF2059 domain-containing protein [Anaeromyxobacter sp.]|nr:DUF2059 domain-containing protein [Anaeromyxobacter sp.]